MTPTQPVNRTTFPTLPTFLGIGSQRCGSSWLAKVLRLHPQITISQQKELLYFNAGVLRHDLAWYAAQFEPGADKALAPARGEITPNYARLGPGVVRAIARLLPDLRIVLVIRHPGERAWSQLKWEFEHLRQTPIDRVPTARLLRHLARSRSRRYSDYQRTIANWSGAFGASALHVAVFDELHADPRRALKPLLSHLGVDPARLPHAPLLDRQVASTGDEVAMPLAVRRRLAEQWREPTRRLNDHLDGRVQHWLESFDDRPMNPGPLDTWTRVTALPERLAYGVFDAWRERRLAARIDAISAEACRLASPAPVTGPAG